MAPYESLLGSPNILQVASDAMHKENSGLVVLATPASDMWRHSTWAFVWHAVNFLPRDRLLVTAHLGGVLLGSP